MEFLGGLKDKQVGDIFEFGRYPQSPEGKEKPIRWLVMRRDSDSLLVVSEYILDAKRYTENIFKVSWSECTLRAWLNGEFMEKAFDESERHLILLTELYNYPGPSTEDHIFVLREKDVAEFFDEVI